MFVTVKEVACGLFPEDVLHRSRWLSAAGSDPVLGAPRAGGLHCCAPPRYRQHALVTVFPFGVPHGSFFAQAVFICSLEQHSSWVLFVLRWAESVHETELCADVKALLVDLGMAVLPQSLTECHVWRIEFQSALETCPLF